MSTIHEDILELRRPPLMADPVSRWNDVDRVYRTEGEISIDLDPKREWDREHVAGILAEQDRYIIEGGIFRELIDEAAEIKEIADDSVAIEPKEEIDEGRRAFAKGGLLAAGWLLFGGRLERVADFLNPLDNDESRQFEDREVGAWMPDDVKEKVYQWNDKVLEVMARPELAGIKNVIPDTSIPMALILIISGGNSDLQTDDGRYGLFGLSAETISEYAEHVDGVSAENPGAVTPEQNIEIGMAHLNKLFVTEMTRPLQPGERPFSDRGAFSQITPIMRAFNPADSGPDSFLGRIMPGIINRWQDPVNIPYMQYQAALDALTGEEN